MVARLLGLRLAVLVGGFRKGILHGLGLVVAAVYLVAVTVALVVALGAVRGASDAAFAADVVTAGGAVILLGFLLLPLFFGGQDAMDPRSFALYGIPTPTLAAGLALAGVLSLPVLALAVVGFASVGLWGAGTAVLAVASVLLGVATAAVLGRLATAVSAFLFPGRAAREALGIVGIVLVLALVPAVIVVTNVDWGSQGRTALASFAGAMRWTPFGAAWAAPGAAESGDVAAASGALVLGVITLLVALAGWYLAVRLMIAAPERRRDHDSGMRMGWFDVARASPAGVIAARSLTYWGRDPRYHLSLAAIPLLPIVMIALLGAVGVQWGLLSLLPLPVIVFFLGWTLHNDLAYDGSAVWLHVASGVPGRSDRLGRAVPTLVIGVPVVVVGSLATAGSFGDPGAYAAILGGNLGILLSLVGVASFASARFPYPAPRPGDSAFVQPQAPGSSGAGAQTASFVGGAILSAPAVYLAVQALFVDGSLGGAALACGAIGGAFVLWLGIVLGGRVFDRRGPELVAFASRY
ncbi:ABC transporter permease [Microbacteriaceae bacterium VKM Ac-2855]|nr:ABC transporter permease [Microbacteriaceae bacterium VKM Ac-2855]